MAKYSTSVATNATSLNSIDTVVSKNIVASLCYNHEEYKNKKLLHNMYNGLAIKIHRAIRYGRDHYTYGLPDGYDVFYNYDREEVEQVIEAELGYPIDVINIFMDNPEADFFGEMYAYTNWGLDQATGILAYPPVGTGDTDDNIYLYKSEIDRNGILKCTLLINGNTPEESDGTRTKTPDLPAFVQSDVYYHVKYTITGATTAQPQYWYYRLGSNEIPELEVGDDIPFGSPYLPIIPLRENNKNLGPEVEDGDYVFDSEGNKIVPDTDLYRTSVKLCKRLDTNFDELCKSITNNPDVKDIDHAYLIFGIDIRTETKTGIHYLFQYFEDMSFRSIAEGVVEIKDANYRIALSFDSCTNSDILGSVEDTVVTYSGNTLILQRNISDTHYREVIVTNLLHTNYIYGKHVVQTTLEASGDEDNYNFIIPLNYTLSIKDRAMFKREELYIECFKLVFNSYERRKLKWYESSFFKFIMLVITVVATAISGVGGAIINAIKQGIIAVVTLAVKALVLGKLISTGFKLLADKLGPVAAIALAIISLTVSIIAPTFNIDLGVFNADNLLSFSNGMFQGVADSTSDMMKDMMKEINDFISTASDLDKELQELEDELNTDTWFNAFDFMDTNPLFIPGESPDSYYTRTIHSGNIGILSLSVPENYVDNALKLPEYKQI